MPELSLLLDIANEPNTSQDTLIKMLDCHLGHLEVIDCCFDNALRDEGKPASIYEAIALRTDISDEIFARLLSITEWDVAVQLDFMILLVSNKFLTLTFLKQIVETYSELFPDEQLLHLFAGIYLHEKANKQFKKVVLDALKEFDDEEIDPDDWDAALAKWE